MEISKSSGKNPKFLAKGFTKLSIAVEISFFSKNSLLADILDMFLAEDFKEPLYIFVSAMPYAIKESGIILGLVTLFTVTWMTDYSLVLMVKCGNIAGTHSYQVILAKTALIGKLPILQFLHLIPSFSSSLLGMQDTARAAFGQAGYLILTILQFSYPMISKYLDRC